MTRHLCRRALLVLAVTLPSLASQYQVPLRPQSYARAPLPASNPTRSFWTDSSPDANPLGSAGSTGPLTPSADVCIIGAGFTGVSTAYHLAQAAKAPAGANTTALDVAVLEARDFCRNGGHLAPHSFGEFQSNVEKFGIYDAIRAVDIEEHVYRELSRIVEKENLADKVDFEPAGRTALLFTEKEVDSARENYEAAKAAGVNMSAVQWLDKDTVEKTYGASYPAVRMPASNVWPLKLVTQLYYLAANATPSLTLHLHTRTPVISITPLNSSAFPRWSLHTPRGAISCSYVVHATNAYASHLLPQLAGRAGIVPTRSQVVAMRADAPLSRSGFVANLGHEYWLPRPVRDRNAEARPLVILGGGREVLPGKEMGEADDSVLNDVVSGVLRTFLPRVFPGKFEVGREPEMEWTGIWGVTESGDPFVGPVVESFGSWNSPLWPGQYIAAGYSGHGMPRAFACADVVARMITAQIAGTPDEWEVPAWLPRHYLTAGRAKYDREEKGEGVHSEL
ncbi:FAD dependent oxidoreductase [Auriscalpium vulgare]|uniref:FAD dependent oxidoreductase n=1 Tax=Auriscalpium vulgare TaxID=40419 RepID=A0ACB8RCX7_9AGAM|nr:FAD dependent oxidoreductase [Auriscalpium vulgare]